MLALAEHRTARYRLIIFRSLAVPQPPGRMPDDNKGFEVIWKLAAPEHMPLPEVANVFSFSFVGPDFQMTDTIVPDTYIDAARKSGMNDNVLQGDSVEAFLVAHGLLGVLAETTKLLRQSFGADANVVAVLEQDSETGAPDLVFEIHVPEPQPYEVQRTFVRQYLDTVRRPAGPSPTLLWDPPSRATV